MTIFRTHAGEAGTSRGRAQILVCAVRVPYACPSKSHNCWRCAMAPKTERIEMRADDESNAKITEAAKAEQVSVSAFVLDAAVKAADHVLARKDVTLMPAEQFDALLASLDTPDEAPALGALARQPRRYVQA